MKEKLAYSSDRWSAGSSARRIDALWNLASLLVLGGSGVLVNVILGAAYGAAIVGRFSILFAAFVVFAQVGVLGLHLSALKHAAEWSEIPSVRATIVASGAALTVVTGISTAIVFALLAPFMEQLFGSQELEHLILLAAPGLALFSINKYSLSVLNGLSRLRVLAFIQALRPIALLAGMSFAALVELPSSNLGGVLTFAEVVVFLASVPFVVAAGRGLQKNQFRDWLKRHLSFGIFSFPGHLLVDLGTRIDILVLGILTTNEVIGIYSFAATLAEGVAQIPIVLRTILNKDVVDCFARGNRADLLSLMRRTGIPTMLIMGVIAVAVLAFYPIMISLFALDAKLMSGWGILLIILCGVVASSALAPFGFALLQSGRPALHTLVMTSSLLANLGLTVALVPYLGTKGAAIATVFTLVATPAVSIVLALTFQPHRVPQPS